MLFTSLKVPCLNNNTVFKKKREWYRTWILIETLIIATSYFTNLVRSFSFPSLHVHVSAHLFSSASKCRDFFFLTFRKSVQQGSAACASRGFTLFVCMTVTVALVLQHQVPFRRKSYSRGSTQAQPTNRFGSKFLPHKTQQQECLCHSSKMCSFPGALGAIVTQFSLFNRETRRSHRLGVGSSERHTGKRESGGWGGGWGLAVSAGVGLFFFRRWINAKYVQPGIWLNSSLVTADVPVGQRWQNFSHFVLK